MAALAWVDCCAWRSGASRPGRPGGDTTASLLAARHPCLLCADCFRSGAQHRGVYEQVVGYRAAATGGQWKSFDSSCGDSQCRCHLFAGDSRRRLPPQRNSDFAAHGRGAGGAGHGDLDSRGVAQAVRSIAGTLEGANPAARDFLHAFPAWIWSLLVAAEYRGCAAADARDGNSNRDPYRCGRYPLCVFCAGRADVLPVGGARKGSCGDVTTAGDRRVSTARTTELTLSARANGYVALTKPDVSFLVLMTTAAGDYMGARSPVTWLHMIHAVFGTMLIAAGTASLHHYMERESDRYMRRTALRPLPSGVLQPREALVFGVVLAVAGAVDLYLAAGALASGLGIATCLAYLLAYTPLKKRTVWATFVGAFPGAIPPMIGWVAATRSLDRGAWLLFGILRSEERRVGKECRSRWS